MTVRARRQSTASLIALILLAALPSLAQSQAAAPAASAPASSQAAAAPAAAALPVLPAGPENPYRRFEIVSLGSFPIMLFYSGFSFDLGRYFANDFNPLYAPWPFQNQYSAPLTDADRYARIGAALGACVVVGAIDAYIHAMKVKKARRLREALEASEP
jgi:hypothetical protein